MEQTGIDSEKDLTVILWAVASYILFLPPSASLGKSPSQKGKPMTLMLIITYHMGSSQLIILKTILKRRNESLHEEDQ